MRLLRPPGREQAEQARGCRRIGELRHREGARALPGRAPHARPDRGRTPCRVRRRPPGPDASGDTGAAPGAAARRGRPHGAGRAVGHGPQHAVRRLGVVVAGPVGCRGLVVGLAVPPGGSRQRPPWRQHHGHPGLPRHRRRLALVGGRGGPGRGPPLPGVRVGGDDVPARRPLRRRVEQAAGRRRAAVADGARRQAGQPARRPGRTARCDRGAPRGRPVRGPTRREDRHRRRGRARQLGRRPVPPHRRAGAGRGGSGRHGGRFHGQHLGAPGRARHPRSAQTPSWPRSRAWSSRPSAPRRRSSGSRTASRRSSCRSCWSSRC